MGHWGKKCSILRDHILKGFNALNFNDFSPNCSPLHTHEPFEVCEQICAVFDHFKRQMSPTCKCSNPCTRFYA